MKIFCFSAAYVCNGGTPRPLTHLGDEPQDRPFTRCIFTVQGGHAALVGALRREEAAARAIGRLEKDLVALQEVLRQRDMDAQRTKMILRLKEDKIARLQVLLDSAAEGTMIRVDSRMRATGICFIGTLPSVAGPEGSC